MNYAYAQQKDTKTILTERIDSLSASLINCKEDSNKVKTLCDLAWNKFNFSWFSGGNYEEVIDYAKQALSLAEKIKFKWGKGRANFILGMSWNEKNDLTESLKYHLTALKISMENGNKILTLNEFYHIGKVYNKMGNYKEALKNHFAALQIIKEINQDNWYSDSYAGIGNVYLNMGNYAEADKYYKDAYALAEKRKVKSLMGEILLYMGNSLLSQGRYDDALNTYFAALTVFRERPNKSRIAAISIGIAKAYCKKAATGYDSLSRVQYYKDAIPYLLNALLHDKEIGEKEGVINAYSGLAEAYRGINDYKNALYYSDLYSQSRDSVYNKAAYLKIADLKINYETQKAAAELKAKQENEKIEEEVLRARMLAGQKLEQEKIMAEEKIANEKNLAEQKLKQERIIGNEKMKYEKSLATEKIKQEKLRSEKQQTNNLLLMGLIIVVVTFVFLLLYLQQRQLKKRAVEKTEAVHKMAELEMQSLRSQLNPHFMFNSLNSIQTLIMKEDSDRSQSYLARFARLLRMLLENAEKPFVPLQKEIDFLQLYLSLESLRVPDLQYAVSIDPSLNTEQILIPNMILQPYVENAIWHGLSYKETDKQLQIRINRDNGAIKYEIEDNGVGRKKAEELKSLFRRQHQSKGMELLNKRFKLLNGEYNSTIETAVDDVIKNNEVTGTLVTIKVPVQLSHSQQN